MWFLNLTPDTTQKLEPTTHFHCILFVSSRAFQISLCTLDQSHPGRAADLLSLQPGQESLAESHKGHSLLSGQHEAEHPPGLIAGGWLCEQKPAIGKGLDSRGPPTSDFMIIIKNSATERKEVKLHLLLAHLYP